MERNRFRKNNKNNLIKKYAIVLAISIALMIVFICILFINKSKKTLNAVELATIDYRVYLKDNEFYDKDYVLSNKQYVESLIKNIVANYKYNMNSNTNNEFKYTYRIDGLLEINDNGTKKSLYTYTENLLPEKELMSNNGEISVNEELNVNYQHFNNIANRFISAYDLSVANTSVLKVNLHIKTEYTEESILTLSIPLTKHTFDIATSNQLASDKTPNASIDKSDSTLGRISILGGLITVSVIIYYAYKLVKLMLDTRTDEAKYKSNVKKILSNYGEYINKTDDFQFNLDEYEIIRVNTFLDLLKIKEDLSRPILMIENSEKTNVVFAITDNLKFIYIFALNMHQKKLAEKNEKVKINTESGVD